MENTSYNPYCPWLAFVENISKWKNEPFEQYVLFTKNDHFLWNNIWAKPYYRWIKFIKYIKKKTKKKQNSFWIERKLLRILERTMWLKLYFTHLIWIYLKFCQNRNYKWKHAHFCKNWSMFSKWTIWVKPYSPWLNFCFRFC